MVANAANAVERWQTLEYENPKVILGQGVPERATWPKLFHEALLTDAFSKDNQFIGTITKPPF